MAIRILLSPRQALDDFVAQVQCQAGDVVIERHGDSFHVFRYDPDAKETGALVFSSIKAAIAAARAADWRTADDQATVWSVWRRVLQARGQVLGLAYAAVNPRAPEPRGSPRSAEIIDLRPYLKRRNRP